MGIVPSLDFVGKTSFAWAEEGGGGGGGVGAIVPSLNFLGKTSFAWAGGWWGGVGDSSVIELRWKDLFALSRIYSPSTFTDTYRHYT